MASLKTHIFSALPPMVRGKQNVVWHGLQRMQNYPYRLKRPNLAHLRVNFCTNTKLRYIPNKKGHSSICFLSVCYNVLKSVL